jgi:TonB family protein
MVLMVMATILAVVALGATVPAASGQSEGASEYAVKAAYLYNFAKSAQWPDQSLSANAPLTIGVVGGDDEFVDTLVKTVAGRTAGAHPIAAKRVDLAEELDLCHLVFFRASAGHKRIQAAISDLHSSGVLLVGEDAEFLRQGGMINLVLKNGTVHFEIDRTALDGAGIKLGPALLALASPGHGSSAAPPSETATAAGESRKLKVGTPPQYPEIAQKMNIKGVVQVEATVRRDGSVKEVRVIGGHPLLADAMVKAVMGWRYEPAAKDSQVVVRFDFGQ